MKHYAIFLGNDHNAKGAATPVGVVRLDGNSLTIVGDDDIMESWHPYFSDEEDTWSMYREMDRPFEELFGGSSSGVQIFEPGEGELEFQQALASLSGKSIKTIEYGVE